ncbi:unnamed protein product [Discula destructiva]
MRPMSTAIIGLLSFGTLTQALSIGNRRPDLYSLEADQRPLLDSPGPVTMPPPSSAPSPSDPNAGGPGGTVILSDVMGRDRAINIFAGLVRDVASVSRRLDDAAQNSTVLAPLNSAMEKMSRKPWEDARDYGALGAEAYAGDEGRERAQRNIRRFVEAHIMPVNPWKEGEKVEAVGGGQVWWESKDGAKVVSGVAFLLQGNCITTG